MAALEPFVIVTASATGKTLIIQTSAAGSSLSGTIDSTGGFAPALLVSNVGANPIWFRMSSEATPTATQNDIPMMPNAVRLFANPMPAGKLGVAVTISISTSQFVYFTPGQGGV